MSPNDTNAAGPTREEYLAMVFNSSREMMLFARVEPGVLFRVISVNRRYVETVRRAGLEITAADLEGKTFAEITRRFSFPAEHTAEIRARFNRAIESGQPVHYDEVTPAPAGVFHGRTTVTPVAAADGSCGYVLYSSQDVTEQVRAAESLRESEEKFAKAFRASPYSLTISDLGTGRYVDVNLGFERITDYTREEVIGRTSLELGLWRNPADRDELLHRLQKDGSVRDMEMNFVSRRGRSVVARCSCETVELGGRRCLLNVIEDVTEQRAAERERAALEEQLRQTQKLEALGTLAGGIAHDFNNILTAIIVNQQLAVMEIDNPLEVRMCLNEISRASTRAKELVTQILAFSRRQEPRLRFAQSLAPLVAEAIALVRASIPASIEIVTEFDPATPAVLADATQIHQIMMNLCANGAYAMRGRRGRLMVQLGPRALSEEECRSIPGLTCGPHVRLMVEDTGHGMSEAVLAKIFEPFFTTKPAGEGTGLGLPVIHGIIKDHGGAILVRSHPGAGTTFELLFPAASPSAPTSVSRRTSVLQGHGERILVVDDEEAIVRLLEVILNKLGYKATAYADAVAALACFDAEPENFDLVLTDMSMPRLTGHELVARIRRQRTDIPIIVMTGAGSPMTGDEAKAFHMLTRIAKPLDILELSEVLRRILEPSATP